MGVMVTQTLQPQRRRDGLDVGAYLARVGYREARDPTLATLRGLVTAHLTRIPFENLDPMMGSPVFDLSAAALSAKLVQRRRGGTASSRTHCCGTRSRPSATRSRR